MQLIARIAVPAVVGGLLLTACGPKSGPAQGGGPLETPASASAPLGYANGGGPALGSAPSGALMQAASPASAVTPLAGAPAATADGHLISTRGVGRATGTPDTAMVLIGVSTRAASARAALEANNGKADTLIDVLRKAGVASKDLRTSQLNINPIYNDKAATITGYQVENTVQATLHDLAKAGALLDAAVGAVGDAARIQQISFSIGDDSALRAQARARAVSQAKTQAAQLAQAAGVSLGSIRSLTEVADAGVPVTYDMGAPASTAAASVPLQAGQQDITVAVDLVYDIG